MERPRVDYDCLAPNYDARYQVKSGLAHIESALLELAARGAAQRILEVGCGTGRWLLPLAGAAPVVVGADASLGMLARARGKGAGFELVAGRANQLPFAPASFDLIFTVNALHHFEDPAAFAGHARELLRPGGTLASIGMDPRLERANRYYYEYFEGAFELDLRRYPSLGQQVDALAAAGFERVEIRVAEWTDVSRTGRDILEDPFLQKESNSLLALLPDPVYEEGCRRIAAAAENPDAVFRAVVRFFLITAQVSPSSQRDPAAFRCKDLA